MDPFKAKEIVAEASPGVVSRAVQTPKLFEEKFGEQNFWVFSEMRGKNLYIDPSKSQFWVKI